MAQMLPKSNVDALLLHRMAISLGGGGGGGQPSMDTVPWIDQLPQKMHLRQRFGAS